VDKWGELKNNENNRSVQKTVKYLTCCRYGCHPSWAKYCRDCQNYELVKREMEEAEG